MELTTLSRSAGLVRLECRQDITASDCQGGEPRLERWLGLGWERGVVVFGLAGASYIDSGGIGWLVCLHKQCKEAGGRLILHSLSPMVQHAFKVLDLHPLLQVAADEAAALELVGPLAGRTP